MTKVFQSLLTVDWQQLPTARIWDQTNCLLLSMLACSPCDGHCSLAVHLLVARLPVASPSPSLLPCSELALLPVTHHRHRRRYSSGELAGRRKRAQPASSLASAFLPSPPPACHHSHRCHSGLLTQPLRLARQQRRWRAGAGKRTRWR